MLCLQVDFISNYDQCATYPTLFPRTLRRCNSDHTGSFHHTVIALPGMKKKNRAEMKCPAVCAHSSFSSWRNESCCVKKNNPFLQPPPPPDWQPSRYTTTSLMVFFRSNSLQRCMMGKVDWERVPWATSEQWVCQKCSEGIGRERRRGRGKCNVTNSVSVGSVTASQHTSSIICVSSFYIQTICSKKDTQTIIHTYFKV